MPEQLPTNVERNPWDDWEPLMGIQPAKPAPSRPPPAKPIDDLSDVTISGTPADNEFLAYSTGTGVLEVETGRTGSWVGRPFDSMFSASPTPLTDKIRRHVADKQKRGWAKRAIRRFAHIWYGPSVQCGCGHRHRQRSLYCARCGRVVPRGARDLTDTQLALGLPVKLRMF